jgi:hypothetical protein
VVEKVPRGERVVLTPDLQALMRGLVEGRQAPAYGADPLWDRILSFEVLEEGLGDYF